MNRSVTLIIFSVLVVGSIAAFVYYKKNYFPKYRWNTEYQKKSDKPYGLNLFYTVIKNQSHKTILLYNQAYEQLDTSQGNSNFIFIGNDLPIDSATAQSLLKYAEKGNRVLISTNYCPVELVRNFVPVGDTISDYRNQSDSIVSIRFAKGAPYPGKLKFHYQFLKDTSRHNWSIYQNHYFNDTLSRYGFTALSFLNDSSVNAFYICHGKGKIILHANPILFTNFYLVRQNGFEHANNILAQLHAGPSYWNEPEAPQGSQNYTGQSNPLQFLFSHPYLKWAWYLLLVTILLYLIFRSKREQRIIPLMPVNTNASIEYTKAIGTLYFQSKGHDHIANELYTVFLSEIRSRYNLATDIAEAELTEQLAMRSGISKGVLYNLFKQFKNVRTNTDAKADDLVGLYNAIENYHKKRK